MTIHRETDPRSAGRIRIAASGDVEIRAGEGEESGSAIIGHGAVFDQETELWPGYTEVIRAGAFAKTVQEADVRGLFNHDANYLLGRTAAGTLRLEETEHGLAYEIDAPDTPIIRDLVLAPLARGDLDASSFAFRPVKDRETIDEDGNVLRELLELKLYDVSPVTFPAYPGTDASLRAAVARDEPTPNTVARVLERSGLTSIAARESLDAYIRNERGEGPQRGETSLDLYRRRARALRLRS